MLIIELSSKVYKLILYNYTNNNFIHNYQYQKLLKRNWRIKKII